jgi:phage terminase large subunit-like protein
LKTTQAFYPNPVIDHGAVKDYIRKMSEAYIVEAVGYDARYFVEGAEELANEGLPMIEIRQTWQRLAPVYSELYQAIVRGDMKHYDDPVFRNHVLSANAMHSKDGSFMLKKDPKTKVHIDAAVAMAIAFATYSAPMPKKVQSFGWSYKDKTRKNAA